MSTLAHEFLKKEPSDLYAASLMERFGPLGVNAYHGPIRALVPAIGERVQDWLECLVTLRWLRDVYPIVFGKIPSSERALTDFFDYENQAPIWKPLSGSGASDEPDSVIHRNNIAHIPITMADEGRLYFRTSGHLVGTPYRQQLGLNLRSLDDPISVLDNDLYIPEVRRKEIARRVWREAMNRELRLNTTNSLDTSGRIVALVPRPKNLRGALFLSLLMDLNYEPVPAKICVNPRCRQAFYGRADAVSCGKAGCQKFVTQNGLGRKGSRAATSLHIQEHEPS